MTGTPEDVLVVGAGPVGLTAACGLARLGVSVRLVDVLDRPTTESRAIVLHARSLETLAPLGVVPALDARGRRIGAIEMVDGRSGRTRARGRRPSCRPATRTCSTSPRPTPRPSSRRGPPSSASRSSVASSSWR